VRGGFPAFGGFNRVTYALYVGNGPTLEADGGEIEMIETPGLGGDPDGKKVVGGRLGLFLAQRRLELGISGATGKVATEGGTWRAWYLQAAYRFRPTQWEAVARYADYDTPHDSQDLRQWTLGVNYVFAPNIVAKLAYELNDNPNTGVAPSVDDRMLVQMSYGF